MSHLTPKQRLLFEAIEDYSEAHGHPPSYRELAKKLGYASTASIYRFVKSLKKKGVLADTPRSWRNLEPTKVRPGAPSIEIEVIGHISRPKTPELFSKTSFISVPSHIVGKESNVYGLLIQDTSFIEEHLLPQDLLLVEPVKTIEQGELVLASTDQTIIGHYFEEEDLVRFRSSPFAKHQTMTSITIPEVDVQIWGAVIALFRTFGRSRDLS